MRFIVIVVIATVLAAADGKGIVLIIGGSAGLQLGAYNTTGAQTPNLDALAKQGVLFTNAFTNNVAGGGPSRATILSGLPSHQNGQFGPAGPPSDFQAHWEVQIAPKIVSDRIMVKTGIIGVTGAAPDSVFKFDYSQTEKNNDEIDIGRNITLINQYVSAFLNQYKSDNFFLTISLGDVERCPVSRYGQFCERYGDGTAGMGRIPDWKPVTFNPDSLTSPYFVSNAPQAKGDLANYYRSYNRLDQGVGLYLQSIQASGADALVIYTSTGGMDFPGARYNAFEGSTKVPLIAAYSQYAKNAVSNSLTSSVDLFTTFLDFFGVPFPPYSIFGQAVIPTGQSLVPILRNPSAPGRDQVFFGQESGGQLNADFPIRGIRNGSYTLIRNSRINYPLSADIFNSPTLQFVLNMTRQAQPTGWWKQYTDYITRKQFELYDHSYDPYEVDSVAYEPKYANVMSELRKKLQVWQQFTNDPWICDLGYVWANGQCQIYW